MYVIIITIVLLLILIFWDTFKIMLSTMSPENTGLQKNGYLWFICLSLINLIIVGFIIWFYHYKINQIGPDGIIGMQGNKGLEGEKCIFNVPC